MTGGWIVKVGKEGIVVKNRKLEDFELRFDTDNYGWVEFENEYYKGVLYYGSIEVKQKKTGKKFTVDFYEKFNIDMAEGGDVE